MTASEDLRRAYSCHSISLFVLDKRVAFRRAMFKVQTKESIVCAKRHPLHTCVSTGKAVYL